MLRVPEMSDVDGLQTRQAMAWRVVVARLWITLVVMTCVLPLQTCCSGETSLADIAALVERSAAPGPDITKEEEATAQRVRSLGPQAIPYLLPLLKKEGDKEVRELASYILGGMEGLTEEHLDALTQSRRNGDVWIPPAIARVGTPEAIAFLVEELKKAKTDDPQLVTAFQILGERAVPPCVELIKSGSSNVSTVRTVLNIFRRLGEKAESAIVPLTEFISNKESPENRVITAVVALGAIGPKARTAVPALLALPKGRLGLIPTWVDDALAAMRAPEALPRLIQRLDRAGPADHRLFYDIGLFKEKGREAGPALLRCLRQNRLGTREWAARTLGFVGYAEAIPDLLPLLQSSDWRVVYASVESLGRLHAKDALGPLDKIAASYWHPAVHEAANKAIRVIRGTAQYEPGIPLLDYGSAEAFNQDDCADIPRSDVNHFYVQQRDHLSREQLKKLAYEAEITSFGVGKDGRTPEKHVTARRQVPNVGIRVEGGYLLGSNRGEWGGDLIFRNTEGRQTILLDASVCGIYRMTSGIVVITEAAQVNRGAVFTVSKSADGTWRASKWKELPGEPLAAGVRPNGNLFVACYKEEKMEISPSGDVETVNR
jgi:HEAT repeat protein